MTGFKLVREEVAAKYPTLDANAARWPLKAIRGFCLVCMGGSPVEVSRCESVSCYLHPFRSGKRLKKGVPDDSEPAEA